MPTSNTSLRVAELDFFKIRENLKNYLRSQSVFTDYDFEGSGMSVLLDLLAYNTHYNSFYLNMAANEAFLDTAQIRQNILSQAKAINYIPASSQGALAKLNIIATPSSTEDMSTNVLTLNKFTRLIGQDIDGENYTFVTINSNTAPKINGSFTFANVFVKQGEVITNMFEVTANNVTRRYQIPSSNVDTTTISVTIQQSSSNTYTTQYIQADDLTEIKSDSRVYFLEEDDDLKYTIYFGDNVLGKSPENGNLVIVTYLDTLGAVSNNISKFTFAESIGGKYRDNVRITGVTGSYGGVDKEPIDTIRFRAPYFYTAQNRCVTVHDYESLIMKDYNNIDSVAIWGGEDNVPVVYGKVYLSLKTKNYFALSNLEKEKIKDTLIRNRNVLTIIPEIVDPDYVFLLVRGKVTYDPSLTSRTADEVKDVVKAAINRYAEVELNKFRATFKKSKLQFYIDNCEPSVTGSNIYVYIQKRVPMVINQNKNYDINFNTQLAKGDFLKKLYTYPEITISDASNVLRKVFIEEVPNSFTGIDSIDVINPGSNYESAPTVTIQGDGSGATAVAVMSGPRIKSITVTNKGINYSRATVLITGGNGSEGYAVPNLQARNGTLRTFFYKDNGEKVIVNDNAGTIDYDTGEIRLLALSPLAVTTNDFYGTDLVTFNVIPADEIIVPTRNRILAIDNNNLQSIQVEMIAES